ncbi:MerR family transcriptional regulator [Thermotomaculum hydrothermale]|uniref:MerR family transcriptional regulator n=1 Tax=Thermotomaculum hydrothermale TaxID=981385 RepID=A0A7R6PFM4_9BACT|nr:MerR family transcriptional regulator [Thermotomaculum hydrothermale]BBB31689.1 MerR family transcriptional regulator [Thermotomaculum hydrothermale]
MAKFLIPAKRFYKIGEVSKIIGEPASTIRFWEKEFPQLKPVKNNKGQRVYSDKEIELLKVIKQKRDSGLTIEGIKRDMKEHKNEIKSHINFKNELKEIKQELENLLEIFKRL